MKIAFVGIRGIPASYGGFETFVEQWSVELAAKGCEVTVYNRSSVSYRDGAFCGVRLVRIPTVFRKHFETFLHTFFSVCHALFVRYDIVFFCGVGNSPLLWIPKLAGSRVVIHVDGLDWGREKWGRFAQGYLKACEQWALFFSDETVTDSHSVAEYYRRRYGRTIRCIPYGIKPVAKSESVSVLKKYGLEKDRYILFVSRLVPENGAHRLVEAYRGLRTSCKLVIVGGATYSDAYIHFLRDQGNTTDIVFTGFIFGDEYRQLLSNAYIFVLPSVVSGTRMVLLEAMAFGNCVLANAGPSNLEVIADAGITCPLAEGVPGLREKMQYLLDRPDVVGAYRQKAAERIRRYYSWEQMATAYAVVFNQWKR